jgi:hypothetical protein
MDKKMGSELPTRLYQFFKENTMTGVASTVDEDGFPRGAPISMFYAVDEKTILMGVQNGSTTFRNARRHGLIALTFISGEDSVFTIQAEVKVFKEKMENSKYIGILCLEIKNLKSNVADDVEVKEGLKLAFRSQRWKDFVDRILAELRSYQRGPNGDLIQGEPTGQG